MDGTFSLLVSFKHTGGKLPNTPQNRSETNEIAITTFSDLLFYSTARLSVPAIKLNESFYTRPNEKAAEHLRGLHQNWGLKVDVIYRSHGFDGDREQIYDIAITRIQCQISEVTVRRRPFGLNELRYPDGIYIYILKHRLLSLLPDSNIYIRRPTTIDGGRGSQHFRHT